MNWTLITFIVLLLPPLLLILSFIVHLIYYLFKGYRLKKGKSVYKKKSIWKRILLEFPNQFWIDRFNSDPDEFREYGLHLFCGEQGSGKTTAVVNLIQTLREKYPKMKIRTNFNFNGQDGEIESWQQLVKNENGIYGQVEVIDEIQTWFNSMQSKDFPPEMLTEISQQRKQRKMLVGTSQVFGRVAKPIREQTTFVYLPMTIFGCLTIVRVTKAQFYDEEKCDFKRYLRTYFFVHNDKIRNAFDTYKKIEGLTKSGFKLRSEFYTNNIKSS